MRGGQRGPCGRLAAVVRRPPRPPTHHPACLVCGSISSGDGGGGSACASQPLAVVVLPRRIVVVGGGAPRHLYFFFLHARASVPLPFHPSTAFRGEGAGHHPRLPAYSVTAANDARQGGPSEGAAQYRQERAPLGEMWMGGGVGRPHRPLRAARHGSVPLGVEYSPTWTTTPVCSAGGDRVGGDDNEGEPVLVGRPVTWRTWRQGKLAAPPLPKELHILVVCHDMAAVLPDMCFEAMYQPAERGGPSRRPANDGDPLGNPAWPAGHG